jgi:hypothetical protein
LAVVFGYFRSQEHRLREVEDQEPEDLERVSVFYFPFAERLLPTGLKAIVGKLAMPWHILWEAVKPHSRFLQPCLELE